MGLCLSCSFFFCCCCLEVRPGPAPHGMGGRLSVVVFLRLEVSQATIGERVSVSLSLSDCILRLWLVNNWGDVTINL